MKTLLLILLTIVFVGRAEAQSDNPIASLDWQRTHLQELIDKRIHRTVSPIVSSDNVMVETTVKLTKTPPRQRIRLRRPSGREETRGLFPLSKLGVWIDSQALQESEGAKTPKNIFANITEVESYIAIDQKYAAQAPQVQKAVENTLARLGSFKAVVNVEPMEFTAHQKTASDFVYDFKAPIGFLLATLLLVFLAVWIAGRYQKIETQKMKIMEAQAQAQSEINLSGMDGLGQNNESEESSTPAAKASAGPTEEWHGVSQFKRLLTQEPERCYVLIKQWLSGQSEGSVGALKLIPAGVEMEILRPLFDQLSEDERKSWREVLSQPDTGDFTSIGNDFLLSQIVGSLLEPPIPVQKEMIELLSGITPNESVKCAERDPYWGAVFANSLSTVQVAKMFSMLPKDLADRVVEESVRFKFEEVGERFKELKSLLDELRSGEKVEVNPLLAKTVDLIREIGPEKEATFFRALAKAGEEKLLEAAANQFFPAEAIPQLPKSVLRTCLRKLTLSFRSELLISLDDELHGDFMDALGDPGAKIRELMESEIEQIRGDEQRVSTIRKNRSQLWSSFVQVLRQTIKDNPSMADDVEAVVQGWIANQMVEHGSSHAA